MTDNLKLGSIIFPSVLDDIESFDKNKQDKHEKDKVVMAEKEKSTVVHLRAQQRNGKKCLTTIQGLSKSLDKKLICKAMKKLFATNGTIIDDVVFGEIIQLQGDFPQSVKEFLIKNEICQDNLIKIHGT